MSYRIPRCAAYSISALLLIVASHAAAQEPAGFPLTFSGGYQGGLLNLEFQNMAGYTRFNEGDIGITMFGLGAGEFALMRISPEIDIVLAPRVTFRNTTAAFVHDWPDALIVLPGQITPVPQRIERRFAFSIQDIGLDLRMLMKGPNGLAAASGLGIGYRSLRTWRLTENLLEPANARFVNSESYPAEEDGRILILSDGSEIQADRIFAVLTSSLLYEVPLGRRLSIIPELSLVMTTGAFGTGGTFPDGGNRWSSLSYGGSLSLRYNFGSDEPVPTPLLPPTGDLQPVDSSTSPLTASIDLFTLDGDTRLQTLRLVTTRNRRSQESALLPVVTFEPGETTLPARYAKIDPATVQSFSLDSIARLDAARVEAHLLNIIGSRLHVASREKLRLVISRAGGSAERARAESVRSYLKDVWQIAPSRLTIETSGAAGKGSVGLAGSPTLLAALKAEWIEQQTVAAPLQIDPRIEGGVGPRTWMLTLRRGDLLVARHMSESREAISLDLALGAPAPGEIPAPLTAELSVRDSSGATATARDTLEVVPVMGE